MPEDLQKITFAAAKDEDVPTKRIPPQHFLDLQREAVHALAHVGAAGGKPDPRPTWERDHHPTSARSAAATTAGSGAPEIRTRSPPASSISISPDGADTTSATDGGVAGAISTAAKPGTLGSAGTVRSISGPARYSLRQAKSWLGLTPLLTIVLFLFGVAGTTYMAWFRYEAEMREVEADKPWARRRVEGPR